MWSPTRVVERMIAQTARNPGSGRLHPKTHSLTKGSYRLYKDHLSGELPLRHKLIHVRKWKHIYRIIDTHTYRLINCFYEYQPPLRANLLHLYFMFATKVCSENILLLQKGDWRPLLANCGDSAVPTRPKGRNLKGEKYPPRTLRVTMQHVEGDGGKGCPIYI